jgi:hypothetical protein
MSAKEISAIVLGVRAVLGGRERRQDVGVQERVIRAKILKEPPDGVRDT